VSIAVKTLKHIASLLEDGEPHEFTAFGESRGMQANLKDGKVDSFEMWGNGGQSVHCYPEPVTLIYAALCVVKSIVDDKEGDPKYATHTKEFYDFLDTAKGKEITAEAKWKGEEE
jgi:hypothetical protein